MIIVLNICPLAVMFLQDSSVEDLKSTIHTVYLFIAIVPYLPSVFCMCVVTSMINYYHHDHEYVSLLSF